MKPINHNTPEIDENSNSAHTHLNVSLINTKEAFFNLKDDWTALLQESNEPHIFLSWEWLFTWWQTYANKNDELMILTLHQDEALVGIVPFYVQQNSFSRVLRCLGDGEPQHESVTTHYQDIICPDNVKNTVVKSVAAYFNQHSKWDYSEFRFVLDHSCLYLLIEELGSVFFLKKSLGYRYRLNLKRTFEDIYNSLGKSARKAFRSKRNRMKSMGEVSLASLDLSDSLDKSLNTHVEFHTHRQKILGHAGIFLESRFKDFHHKLITQLEHTDSLHNAEIRVLNVSEEPIACTLNYISNNVKEPTVYAYSAGFKSSDDARLSPMFVFDLLEFEQLIDRGICYYDFLSASEESTYKTTYKAEQEAVSKVHWFEKTPKAFIAYAYFKVRFRLSFLKQHFKKMQQNTA